jgi:lipocalin-like protein
MRILALWLLLVASPAFAQDSPLIGNWKLVSYQTILDNAPPKDLYGARPKGVLIVTRGGRMAVIVTAESRKFGTGDAEWAELHKSMIAYSGNYRVNGKEFVTTVEMSWNETWNGTEQKRYWKIEDGKLFLETVPLPSPNFPGRTAVGRTVWERDK